MKFTEKQKTELINDIKDILKDNLTAILIYGSYVRGDFIDGKSDINILIVRKNRNNLEFLKLHKIIKKWNFKINMDIPLILTEEEIKSSTDVFPMEYSDIKENHYLLYGDDIFKTIEIEDKNLRLELENQVKSKLILLRRHFILNPNRKIIKKILFQSLTTTTIILKNIIKLNKKEITDDIISQAEGLTNINLSVILKIKELKAKEKANFKKNLLKLFDELIILFEKLSDYVDKFKIKEG